MADLKIYVTDEELEFVRSKGKGFLRELLQDRIVADGDTPDDLEPLTVYLTSEQLTYVREREQKNGPGWFGRVADVNIAARDSGKAPFYWLKPEGIEES